MVYGSEGRLLFSGGITAARGHFGENAGASTSACCSDEPRRALQEDARVRLCAIRPAFIAGKASAGCG